MNTSNAEFDPFDSVSRRITEVGFDQLNEFEKAYYAVSWLCFEVDNGGFHQFFFNSSGGYIPEVQEGLRQMEAEKTLSIFNRAIDLLPTHDLPRDDVERREMLATMSTASREALNDLDGEFDEYPDDIYSLRDEFALKNRHKFLEQQLNSE